MSIYKYVNCIHCGKLTRQDMPNCNWCLRPGYKVNLVAYLGLAVLALTTLVLGIKVMT